MSTTRHIAPIGVAILLLAGWAAAQSDNGSPSTAPAAKPVVHVRHVITNDDIPPRPEAEPENAKNQPAAKKSASQATESSTKPFDKAGTETAPPEVRDAIEQLKKQEALLQEKLGRIKERLANEDDDFRRQMWSDALENQKATLEQFRKVRERLEREQQHDSSAPQAATASGS